MQELKQGQQPSLNLVQVENEEGDESKFLPDMGENIMIHRSIVIPERKKRKYKVVVINICGFEQIFFEPGALPRERHVKLLLIVEVVRIWFPKRW